MSVPPLLVCALAASLYALGGRGRHRVWRETAFYGGVASVLIVLEPPFDTWADTSFALHMTQQAVRLVLRDHADAANAGVQAVRQREIDDPELAVLEAGDLHCDRHAILPGMIVRAKLIAAVGTDMVDVH